MDTTTLALTASGAAAVAFIASSALTPLARWVAIKTDAVDRPDGTRKLQRRPVALFGGVAVLAGLGVTVLVAACAGVLHDTAQSIFLVSTSLALLCAVGLYDDLKNLSARKKLMAQILATLPIVAAGCSISRISLLGAQFELGDVGVIVSVGWLIACTNAVNLIDGMDGLCSVTAMCIASGVAAVACFTGASHTVICSAALAGSLGGFLIYNRPAASIYLGDAGSMVIGMTLGLLTLQSGRDSAGCTHPLIMGSLMAVPLGDVGLAMLRRRLSGKSIWQADRGHIHHRLLDKGMRVSQALLAVAAICMTTSAIAVVARATATPLLALALLAMLGAVLINRQVMGHVEWSLLARALSRSAEALHDVATDGARATLRFDQPQAPHLRIHRPDAAEVEEVETDTPARRRAA